MRLLSLPVFCNSNFDDTSLGIVYERAPAIDSREHRLLTLQPSTDDEIEMPSQRPSLSRLLSDNSVAIAAEDEAAASEEEPELEFAILEPSAVSGLRESRDRFEYAVIEEEHTDADPNRDSSHRRRAWPSNSVTVDWDAQTLCHKRRADLSRLTRSSLLHVTNCATTSERSRMVQQAAGEILARVRNSSMSRSRTWTRPRTMIRARRANGKASADSAVRGFSVRPGRTTRYVL